MKQNNSTELLGHYLDNFYNKKGPPDPQTPIPDASRISWIFHAQIVFSAYPQQLDPQRAQVSRDPPERKFHFLSPTAGPSQMQIKLGGH